MILLISIQVITDSEIIPYFERLPIELRKRIDRIYCIVDASLLTEAPKNKVIQKKPVLFYSNEKQKLDLLIRNLYFYEILVHAKNTDTYLYYVLSKIKHYELYIDKSKQRVPKYVDDKELFLITFSELSKIDFSQRKLCYVSNELKRIIQERQSVFPKKDLESLILAQEESILLHFSDFPHSSKMFNEIKLLNEIPVFLLFIKSNKPLKKEIHINNQIIEFWIGIEYMSEEELSTLIYMIKNNTNKLLKYRLVVRDLIPKLLSDVDIKIVSYNINDLIPTSFNQSKQLYYAVLKAIARIPGNSVMKIYHFPEVFEKDSLSHLINFSKFNLLQNAVFKIMPLSRKILELAPFRLDDCYFWYKLNEYFINIPRSRSNIKKLNIKPAGKLSELTSSRIVGQFNSIPESSTKELDSKLPNELKLELKITPKKNSKEKICKWDIYYNEKKIGQEKYDARFVQVIEELYKNYQSKIVIDAEKLAEIIYKAAQEKKGQTRKSEKTFRQLRFDFQEKYKYKNKNLGNIAKYFVFTSEECYFDPNGELRLKVVRSNS